VEEQLQEQLQEVKQQLEVAQETIEDQEFALEVGDEEIARLKDNKRKHKASLESKAEEKRVAVQKAKETEKEKWERKMKADEELKEKELNNHKKEVEMQYRDIFEAQRKSVNVAHAEKRAAWKRTAQANCKAKRLAVENDHLKTVDKTESESEASEDESMGEDSPCRPRQLGFEVMPRRDERGRFQAESDEVRALKWAQYARGVSPSTVKANIQGVLSLLAHGVVVPACCPRQAMIERGEVTLAGELMAACAGSLRGASACSASDGMRRLSLATP
jgi:hypothetical protein